jgi:hypothetical protein
MCKCDDVKFVKRFILHLGFQLAHVNAAKNVTLNIALSAVGSTLMESFSIDVYAAARKKGFDIEVLKTHKQKPTYFGLMLVSWNIRFHGNGRSNNLIAFLQKILPLSSSSISKESMRATCFLISHIA